MNDQQNVYFIALTMVPGVGDIIAKNLIAYMGSAEAVFKASKSALLKAPKVGSTVADAIAVAANSGFERALQEVEFCKKHTISILPFTHELYPVRLKQCEDAPTVLYTKGSTNLNMQRMVAIVGTRTATSYGKDFCKQLVEGLAREGVAVVSGLAYGVDIAAHKAAIEYRVATFGVLGHGLDTIYPAEHREAARQMLEMGALITEHPSKSKIDPSNFVTRNRIIAGMTDATIVVESGERGGALITTEYAASYNRDVCALPGKSTDKYSRGCNNLIKKNKAALIESVDDLFYALNWTKQEATTRDEGKQLQLFTALSAEEQLIADFLRKENDCPIDILCHQIQMPMAQLSVLLFTMEMNGLIKTLPGKRYRLL